MMDMRADDTIRSAAGPEIAQRRIRLPQLMLSLLVVAIFALLAVWWQANTTARSPVVALARDASVGVPLTNADLREISISADLSPQVVPAEFADVFVGAIPVVDLREGTLLNDRLVRSGVPVRPGEAFVGLRLEPTRAPSGLAPGDRVQVLGDEVGQVLASAAQVESVVRDGGAVIVRLRMPLLDAQVVQPQAGQVAVIEIDNSDPLPWLPNGES